MKSSLKFCMITTFYPPYNFGGDGIYIRRLSNALASRGHKVDVFHCEDAYRLQQKAPKGDYNDHPNVDVVRLKSRAGFLSPLLTQQTGAPFFKAGRIKEKIEEEGYDVIHYHNMSLIGITALRYGSAVKLYTMHEHWLVCPMHVLWKFNREVCRERSCLLCVLAGKRPPQLWRYTGLMKKMLGHVDGFISPSRFTRRKHHELGMDVPIEHIPYFLPQDREAADTGPEGGMEQKKPYFLFVGRLEKIKGLQNLVSVFRDNGEYDLLVAGDGEYEEVLKNAAAGVDNIKFLGRLNHDTLKALYRQAVAVIVPSICYEVFGIIIIESFAMKTPVIVNNLGAMPEVIEDSGGGYVYSSDDELVAAMRKLGEHHEHRNELGRKGYDAYLKLWSDDSHIHQYLTFIERIAEQKRAHPGGS